MGNTGASRPFEEAMGPVAAALLGKPNAHLSKGNEVRYGAHGSLWIDLNTGRYYDHEAKEGGGVLDLISRQIGCSHQGAIDWLRNQGLLSGAGAELKGAAGTGSSGGRTGGSIPPTGAKPQKKIVATYDYTDESGNLLFQVCRFEPKQFLQRRLLQGNWTWTVKGVRQVPYRLPELLEAIANDRPVYIVEGEKDVDNLAKWGIAATCNAGGAGKWREDFSDFFRDADVIAIPDNDIPGREHAEQVGSALASVARSVRRLELPDLPAKGDVSDWMGAGGTPEVLHALAERAPPFVQRVNSRFGGQRWEDIGKAGPGGYDNVVEDIIPRAEITLAFGDSGSGKSFGLFDMCMSIVRGEPFMGHNVEPGLVVYVAAEGAKGFAKRKVAYSIQHELDPAQALPFYLCTRRPNFMSDDTDVLALIEEINAVAKSYSQPLVLIVLDTLSALAPGMNENASQDVSMVRRRLVMMQEQFDAGIVLVHHKPKGGSTPRGHGSLTADFETTIEFETVIDRKTTEGKTIHRATVRKQREGKSGITWSFTLPVVEVGKNKWGNPETSCVVQPLTEGNAAAGFRASRNEKAFMECLYNALLDNPQPAPAGLPKSIANVVYERDVRDLMKARFITGDEDPEKADARFRQAFKRAGDGLQDGKIIGKQGEWVWPTGKPVQGFSGPRIDGDVIVD